MLRLTDTDNQLLQQFEISDPIQLAAVASIRTSDIKNLQREIIALNNANPKLDLTELARITAIDLDTSFEGLVHVCVLGSKTPYPDTDCGNIQRYLQYQFLKQRKSKW